MILHTYSCKNVSLHSASRFDVDNYIFTAECVEPLDAVTYSENFYDCMTRAYPDASYSSFHSVGSDTLADIVQKIFAVLPPNFKSLRGGVVDTYYSVSVSRPSSDCLKGYAKSFDAARGRQNLQEWGRNEE